MSVRPCLPWPHPILRKPAAPVAAITDEIIDTWQDMIDTMEAMPGVGLAAPQIAIGLRLAVVDASETRRQAVRMANPEILETSSDTIAWEEASPNLPGMSAKITRPRKVLVRFLNPYGEIDRREFEDLWAVSAQHQIDHLNGKLYFSHLSKLKRDMMLKKARRMA